jgi:hypothetical protein
MTPLQLLTSTAPLVHTGASNATSSLLTACTALHQPNGYCRVVCSILPYARDKHRPQWHCLGLSMVGTVPVQIPNTISTPLHRRG